MFLLSEIFHVSSKHLMLIVWIISCKFCTQVWNFTWMISFMCLPEKRLPIWLFKCYSNQFQIYLSQIFKFFSSQSFLQKGLLWVGFDLGSPGWQPSILTTIPTQRVEKFGLKSKLWGFNGKSGKHENWLQSTVATFEPTNIFFA